jgi:hypothetical protein
MAVRRAEGALELQASEAVVVQAASRILAALIRNGRHTEGNHTALLRFAVRTAYELAQEADRMIQSDSETGSSNVSSGVAIGAGGGAGAGSQAGAAPSNDDILDLLD